MKKLPAKRSLIYILFLIIFLFDFSNTGAQSIEELEKEKARTIENIDFTNKLYQDAKSNTSASLNKLQLIISKISQRNNLVKSIERQSRAIIREIANNEKEITNLEKELKSVKEEYAKMIYYAYKNRNSYQKLMFILSANTFNTAFRRLKYMQQYSKQRKKYAENISSTSEELEKKNKSLENQKVVKENLRLEKQNELTTLTDEQEEQNQMVLGLRSKENSLKKELNEKNRIFKSLEKAIEKAIAEAGKVEGDNSGSGVYRLSPEEVILSESFTENLGKLPWPTERGIITEKFGIHQHPALKKVKVENRGINISTVEGADVRSVFEGIVSSILPLEGANITVLIKHGEYFTVYQNLVRVDVKTGDKVETKQKIGVIFTEVEREKKSVLHFEIWKGTSVLDPSKWLAKYNIGL